MAANNGLSSNKMASRIYKREDNQYKQSMIKEILDMYANEIYKAILHWRMDGTDRHFPTLKSEKYYVNPYEYTLTSTTPIPEYTP